MNSIVLLITLEVSIGIIAIIFTGFVFLIANLNVAIYVVITALLAFLFGWFEGIRREKIRQADADYEKDRAAQGREV